MPYPRSLNSWWYTGRYSWSRLRKYFYGYAASHMRRITFREYMREKRYMREKPWPWNHDVNISGENVIYEGKTMIMKNHDVNIWGKIRDVCWGKNVRLVITISVKLPLLIMKGCYPLANVCKNVSFSSLPIISSNVSFLKRKTKYLFIIRDRSVISHF